MLEGSVTMPLSLQEKWVDVASSGQRNPEVSTPIPRKWTPTRLRQLKKIDDYLDGDWSCLLEAVSSATTWGAECKLDLSLERLTSKDCERLDSLISGKWAGGGMSKKEAKRAELERLRNSILSKPGSTSDSDERELRSIRYQLERLA